jgi:hypothetical protein
LMSYVPLGLSSSCCNQLFLQLYLKKSRCPTFKSLSWLDVTLLGARMRTSSLTLKKSWTRTSLY